MTYCKMTPFLLAGRGCEMLKVTELAVVDATVTLDGGPLGTRGRRDDKKGT
jgi:hypothetical protein